MSFVVLIGASGSGKTAIARSIAVHQRSATKVFYFDAIGVPSEEDMINEYGSGDAWQRAKTIEWMLKLAAEATANTRLLFEGQTRFSFLAEGAAIAGGVEFQPLLVDCNDNVRSRRLTLLRKQPELANPDMMNWARHLRREARNHGHPILDTSALSLSESVDVVLGHLES